MTTQSEREYKPYHITYDFNEYNSFLSNNGTNVRHGSIKHIDDALNDKRLAINSKMPYLWVHEIGVTGKDHFHCYFFSSKSKNTIKKYLFEHTKEALKVSNPNDTKYAKYDKDGVKGVEIYLLKGQTNHMNKNDDLKVIPSIISLNKEYYGRIKNETSRSYKIRSIYEQIIEDLKKYAKECRSINEENKLTEFQLILKDLSEKQLMSPQDIQRYLRDIHYMRPKYVYSDNGFKRLFLKILREKNEYLYKQCMENSMISIVQNAFHL